ncbi:MAG TPA: hypothetical protein VGK06_14430 [Methanosarcina sp.]|jgi:uncharacterized membrane protein
MNRRLYIICIAAVLALVGPALASNSTATVHGTVYDYNTFKPLDNAVVEVNSTPSQSMVAKYGVYSFDLIPGDYNITALYYQNSSITYSATEIIKIKDQGNYVRDLLLLPVYSEELMGNSEDNKSAENSSSYTINSLTDTTIGQMISGKDNSSSTNSAAEAGSINANYLLIAAFLFLLLLVGGYRLSRKDKKIEENSSQKRAYINGKGYVTGHPSKPVKVPEISVEVHDKKIEIPHEDMEPEIKESQVQESRVKPLETASVIEPAETVIDPIKESVSEPVKMPVKESTFEIPEEDMQVEPSEIEEDSPANGEELIESESQKEKKEILFEEPADKLTESSNIEISASKKKLPLPADLQEVMDIIRGQGGRITQKDLRSRLKYSEGKVSLMLADLERRELIEKFKRGRGNVVIIRDEQR